MGETKAVSSLGWDLEIYNPAGGGNGWWPKVNWPRVAHGNRGIFLTDIPKDGLPQTHRVGTVDGYPHGWISPTRLWCSELLGGDDRQLFTVDADGNGRVDAPRYTGFLEIRASRGHWAAWDTQSDLWYDGRRIAHGYHGVRQAGEWVVSRDVADNYALTVFRDGVFHRKIRMRAEAFDWAVLGDGPLAGTVVYGYPQAWMNYPGGEPENVTVSPYGEGASGGGGFALVNRDGQMWLFSCAGIGPDRWGVLARSVGEKTAIVIPVAAASLDAQYTGDSLFRVAANLDTGALVVASVHEDARRQAIVMVPPVPEIPVPPPTPDPVPEPTPAPVPPPEPIPVPVPTPGTIVPKKGFWARLFEALFAWILKSGSAKK